MRFQLDPVERRPQQPHAARYVEPDPTRRHDAARLDVRSRHTADREPVAPMHIGHGIRSAHYPRQRGHVHDLIQRPVTGHVGQQLPESEHDSRYPHGADGIDAPPPRCLLDEFDHDRLLPAQGLARHTPGGSGTPSGRGPHQLRCWPSPGTHVGHTRCDNQAGPLAPDPSSTRPTPLP